VTAQANDDGRLPPDRLALLRTTLALSVDERLAWLEAMIGIAVESGALPKRVPDQLRGAGRTAVDIPAAAPATDGRRDRP
jgi:hypothetical protein